jgi:phosphoribosylformylglycinamidine (FGAM) synthase-like amidotransferase family enzyme
MQTQIEFTASGANSAVGGFSPGDRLRTSPEMAKHLVDVGVAKYVEAPQDKPAEKPAKGKK